MSVPQWEIPLRLWIRLKPVRVGYDRYDMRDEIIDDASTIYAALTYIPANDSEWKGNLRTIDRLAKKVMPLKWEAEETEETDGEEYVGVIELNADEMDVLNKVFTKDIKDFVVRGHMLRTSIYIQDEYESFKKAHPEAFEGGKGKEKAAESDEAQSEARTAPINADEGKDMVKDDLGPRAKRLLRKKMEEDDGDDDSE